MNERVYLIAYEISESLYDYSSLKEAIRSYVDYQHPMETIWFVRVSEENDADSIAKSLQAHFHSPNDHIFVMLVTKEAPHQGWLPRSFWKWLKQNS